MSQNGNSLSPAAPHVDEWRRKVSVPRVRSSETFSVWRTAAISVDHNVQLQTSLKMEMRKNEARASYYFDRRAVWQDSKQRM